MRSVAPHHNAACVCAGHTISYADMTKLTMSPSGRETDVGQSNHVLDEGCRSPWEGTLLRGNRCWPTVKYLKMSGVLAFDRWVHLSLLGMMRHV